LELICCAAAGILPIGTSIQPIVARAPLFGRTGFAAVGPLQVVPDPGGSTERDAPSRVGIEASGSRGFRIVGKASRARVRAARFV